MSLGHMLNLNYIKVKKDLHRLLIFLYIHLMITVLRTVIIRWSIKLYAYALKVRLSLSL